MGEGRTILIDHTRHMSCWGSLGEAGPCGTPPFPPISFPAGRDRGEMSDSQPFTKPVVEMICARRGYTTVWAKLFRRLDPRWDVVPRQ
jgi:hypothetical protein